MEDNLYLYGASGHCKVIIDILKSNDLSVFAIVDDNPRFPNLFQIPVYDSSYLKDLSNKRVIISIGNNKIRKNIANKLLASFSMAIHQKAIVSDYSVIEEGSVVMAGAIINADAKIGKHCIINTAAIIEHDCKIDDFAHISPNASLAGDVKIGEGTQVGIGASIIQGIVVGKWAIIAAGAVIIRDVPDYAVVVGNPGRIIRYNNL